MAHHAQCWPEAADETAPLSPYQQHVLSRLERLLAVGATATSQWQVRLAAHAIRYTLDECGRCDLDRQATALLRLAGRGQAQSEDLGATAL